MTKEEKKYKHYLITRKTKCRSCEEIGTLEYYGKTIKYSYICKNCNYINDMTCLFDEKKDTI